MMKDTARLRDWLEQPVDNTTLVTFRAIFGLLLMIEAGGSILTGWVTEVYVEPQYTFPHMGFGWLKPLPGGGMYLYYAVMAAAGAFVMLGAYFRSALAVFTVMWGCVYFGQTSSYNNHYYLLLLLCFLMLLTPANADFSWDAEKGRVARTSLCPRWCIGIFVAQIAIVYFYASLAKLYPDWLAAKPVEIWMRARAHYPVLGPLYVVPWFKWLIVYGGILFDGLVVPMLLWRPTRWVAVGLSVFFHLFNSYTFRIGIFPYMGIAFCLLFFPGTPLRAWLRRSRVGRYFCEQGHGRSVYSGGMGRLGHSVLVVFFAIQVVLPVRHFLYPGWSHWTEEGHRMSWHMMLRTKSGTVVMRVVDLATGETQRIYPSDSLSKKQARRIAGRPDMLWRYSRILRDRFEAEGKQVAVFADSRVSLNGRPSQVFVDPQVDLSRVEWPCFTSLTWIEPLRERITP